MDSARFNRLTRSISMLLSRRTLTGALSLGMVGLAGSVEARKKRRKRKNTKKVKKNAFGCVNVGSFCQTGDQCCSGICQGKKDKQKCQAHDTQGCQAGQHEPACGAGGVVVPCLSTSGATGQCNTTTGNAGYCVVDSSACFDCTRDADCIPFCGFQAACVVCVGCVGISGTETACAGPHVGGCNFTAEGQTAIYERPHP